MTTHSTTLLLQHTLLFPWDQRLAELSTGLGWWTPPCLRCLCPFRGSARRFSTLLFFFNHSRHLFFSTTSSPHHPPTLHNHQPTSCNRAHPSTTTSRSAPLALAFFFPAPTTINRNQPQPPPTTHNPGFNALTTSKLNLSGIVHHIFAPNRPPTEIDQLNLNYFRTIKTPKYFCPKSCKIFPTTTPPTTTHRNQHPTPPPPPPKESNTSPPHPHPGEHHTYSLQPRNRQDKKRPSLQRRDFILRTLFAISRNSHSPQNAPNTAALPPPPAPPPPPSLPPPAHHPYSPNKPNHNQIDKNNGGFVFRGVGVVVVWGGTRFRVMC